MTPLKWSGLMAAPLVLAACRGVPPATSPSVSQPPAGTSATKAPAAEVSHRRIDAAHSEIRMLVYRTGPMASLGHNHVIVDRAIDGWVVDASGPGTAVGGGERGGARGGAGSGAFHLTIAPADFQVDLPEDRARAGSDFSDDVAADARAGTLHNLLGETQLNAVLHPLIEIDSLAIEGVEPDLSATMRVQAAGHQATVTAPFTLERHDGHLHAAAAFNLRQSELGITPFSVLLGALRVEDEVKIRVELDVE